MILWGIVSTLSIPHHFKHAVDHEFAPQTAREIDLAQTGSQIVPLSSQKARDLLAML